MAAPVTSKGGSSPAHDEHRHRHSLYAAEASGLLIIAVLLLILCLVRYWQYIPWRAH